MAGNTHTDTALTLVTGKGDMATCMFYVRDGICLDECIDMCMDMYMDMCMDMCVAVCRHVYRRPYGDEREGGRTCLRV